jgi:hypothetical protein
MEPRWRRGVAAAPSGGLESVVRDNRVRVRVLMEISSPMRLEEVDGREEVWRCGGQRGGRTTEGHVAAYKRGHA